MFSPPKRNYTYVTWRRCEFPLYCGNQMAIWKCIKSAPKLTQWQLYLSKHKVASSYDFSTSLKAVCERAQGLNFGCPDIKGVCTHHLTTLYQPPGCRWETQAEWGWKKTPLQWTRLNRRDDRESLTEMFQPLRSALVLGYNCLSPTSLSGAVEITVVPLVMADI